MPYQITLPDGSLGWIADSVPRSKALDVAKKAYPEAFPAAPGIGSQLLSVPKEFIKGAASGVVQAVGGLGALPYAGARYLAPSLKPFAETGFGQAITGAEQYLAPSDDGAITQVAGGLGSLASILGPQVALRGLGAAGRFAGMAPAAARPVGVAQVAGLGAEEARQRAEIARGDGVNITPGQELGALTVGAGIGLTELLPVERLLRGVDKAFAPTVANYLKRAATQFGVEGAQEAAAGILQDLSAKGIYNPNMPIGESALGDALLGGTVGGIAQAGLDFLVRKDIAKAYQARLSQERQQELDTRLEKMRQERDAQISQTTKNLGVPDPKILMLPAPAPTVRTGPNLDPLMNPVGFFTENELSPEYLLAANKTREQEGKQRLSQFSIEDLADAGAPQQEIDRLLAYKAGYDGQTSLSAEDVLNLAAERNVETNTVGFRDFLRRSTGSEDLASMSQPQLFSAFKALDGFKPSETRQILPAGTNATRFNDDQYNEAVLGLGLALQKNNSMSQESAVEDIKKITGLKNDRDAESLLQTAIRSGDFSTTSRKVYETVIPGDPEAPAVRSYASREDAEQAARSFGLDVRERIHQEVSFPGAPGELPGGPDIRKGTFERGGVEASYEINSPQAVIGKAATRAEAEAEADRLQAIRDRKANGYLGEIAKKEADIEKSNGKLESMQVDGKADTLEYKKISAGIAAQNKRLQNEINALKAKVQSYATPLQISRKEKPVTREGFTLFEQGNPVATFPTQQAAEEAALMNLSDDVLEDIIYRAPEQKGVMPQRLGKLAKAELERRKGLTPAGFGVSIKGDKAAADERLSDLGIFTPEFQKAADELFKKLRPMMDRMGLGEFRLSILKSIKTPDGQDADGRFSKSLIEIALDAADPMRSLRHEGIHALKELGAFTPAQWKVLEKKARSEWMKKYDIRRRYKEQGLTAEGLLEEAISDAFSDFDQTRQPPGLVGALFGKIKKFFEAFGNALDGMGFKTADSVFQKADQGQLKRTGTSTVTAPTSTARGETADERRFALKTKGKPKENASKVIFEIAPDPDNEEISSRWDRLNNEEKKAISDRVAKQAVTRAMKDLNYDGYLLPQVGSYMDATNPSFAVLLDDGNPVELAKNLGFILRQREMVAISTEAVAGAEPRPAVIVSLGDKTPEEIDSIYQSLRQLEVNGEQIVGGQSFIDGKMVILNYSDVPNDQYQSLIDAKLGGEYEVSAADVFAAYPGKAEYDYSKAKDDPRGAEGAVRQRVRAVREYASKLLEAELRGAGQGRAQVSDPAINIVNRSVTPPDFGKKPTVEDVGNYFDVLVRDEFGGPLDFNNPEHFDRAVRMATEELQFQRESENSGIDWYDEDVEDAFQTTAEFIPSLEDAQKRNLFAVIAGIMSPGTNAKENWDIAAQDFEHYINTGIISGTNPQNGKLWTGGLPSATKRDQLNMLNAMVRDMGEKAAVEWLYSQHPVSEINEFRSRYGGFSSGVSGQQDDIKTGYQAFGPKVGPFISNINGIHEETVDRWMIRTFNRYFGTMIGAEGKIMDAPTNDAQRQAAKELLRRAAGPLNIRSYQAQSMLWFFEQSLFREIGTPAPSYGYSDGARQFRDERAARGLQASGGTGAPSDAKFSLRRDGGRRDQGGAVAPLEGAPTVQGATGPDPRLVEAAQEYARRAGIPLRTQATYVDVDEDFAAQVAKAFDDMPHAPTDPEVREAYESMISQLRDQYDVLADAGYTFTFFDSETDPYDGNPWNALRDLRQNKTMAVYGTYDGYGTEGITDSDLEDNPMLADTGLRWKDQKGKSRIVTANDLFRAVHDAFGHGLEGSGFRARGEENAYQAHVRLFKGPAIKAMTTETRGQNSWLNYGPYGETNRTAKVLDTVFAENKIGIMQPWTWESNIAPDESKPRYSLRQTQTPEFKRWFGDSKVTDESGNALRVYTGTSKDKDFSAFKVPRNGTWFTTDPKGASEYARENDSMGARFDPFTRRFEEFNTASRVIPVYLKIERPAKLSEADSKTLLYATNYRKAQGQIFDRLRAQGFDGVDMGDGIWVVIGDPTQIKSAIGNTGAFDPKKSNFSYSLRRTDTKEFKQWFRDSKIVNKRDMGSVSGYDAMTWKGIQDWLQDQYWEVIPQEERDAMIEAYRNRNADGRPKIMYHGTSRDITEFRAKQAGAIFVTEDPDFAEGFSSMSEDYMVREAMRNLSDAERATLTKQAQKIARKKGSDAEDELYFIVRDRLPSYQNIMPLYVRAEKPFDFESDADIEEMSRTASGKDLYEEELNAIRAGQWDIIEKPHVQRAIKEAGFDAFYVSEGGRKNLAVYSKDQIKSAIGNVGAYGQRPVTQEEADRAGMTVADASAAQARGDIRFALSMKDLSPDSSLVPDEGGNPDGTLGVMPEKFGGKPIRMLIGFHDDLENKGYGANHILLRVLENPDRIPGGAEELLEKIVRTAQNTAQNYKSIYKDGNKLALYDGRNTLILSQRPDEMSVVTMYVSDNPRAKYGSPSWTGRAPAVAQFVQPVRGLPVVAQGTRVGIKPVPVQTKRVFTPSQIAESIVETPSVQTPRVGGTLSVKKGGFKYSLRDAMGKNMVDAIERTTTAREEKGFAGRIADALSPTGFAKFRQGMINRYEGIEQLSRKIAAVFGDKELLADTSAISAALFADRAAGIAAESFRSGVPVYKNGFTSISDMNGSVQGLIPILEPLMQLNDPFAFQAFQFYAATRRGRRLTAEGRENLFTANDIQKGNLLEQNYPMFKDVFDAYQKYNEGLVKFMRDTGVISDQEAKVWTQNWDYIPFYRQLEGDDTAGPKVFSSIAGVAKPKKLKGGDAPLADFLETVVRNSRAAIEAGMKNVAAQRVARDMLRLNQGQLIPAAAATGLDVMTVKENGLTKHYRVDDPLLFEALKGLNLPQLPFLEVLAAPSNLLRNLVTKDPGFMLANLLRDSMQAWVTTGTNMTPIVDTFKQYGATLAGMSPEAKALAKAGLFAGYDFSNDVKSSAREVERELRIRSGKRTIKELALSPISTFWNALDKASSASDVATRAEVYKRTLERTGNEAEALYQAMEVINFSRKGNSALIRVLTALVPFMNARIQGLDVLYRSGFGKSATENRERMQKAFITRSLSILALSSMYWALVSDSDEYKELTEEERDNYWIVPGIQSNGKSLRIPIPFEIGTLFKVFPERILEYSFGQDTGKDLKDSIVRNMTSTLAINPIPQAFLPVVENVANYSFFTGQPIVGKGMEDVAAKFQSTPGTSLLAQQIGESTNTSPMKVDNLIRGYTGTLGTYAVMLIDSVMRGEGDPTKAALRFEQMPVAKRFFTQSTGTIDKYFELKQAVDESTRTINFLERTNNPQELIDYLKGRGGKAQAIKPYIEALNEQMGELRDMRRSVQVSQMDPERKREVLDAIRKSEVALTGQSQRIKQMVY